MTPAITIDPRLIPPLELRQLGKTFCEAIVSYYEDPENMHRFEEWQKERQNETMGGAAHDIDYDD